MGGEVLARHTHQFKQVWLIPIALPKYRYRLALMAHANCGSSSLQLTGPLSPATGLCSHDKVQSITSCHAFDARAVVVHLSSSTRDHTYYMHSHTALTSSRQALS